jgi:hypothetical protein
VLRRLKRAGRIGLSAPSRLRQPELHRFCVSVDGSQSNRAGASTSVLGVGLPIALVYASPPKSLWRQSVLGDVVGARLLCQGRASVQLIYSSSLWQPL